MVLKLTPADQSVIVVAGRPLHCPPANNASAASLLDRGAGTQIAREVVLESPQHITFAPNGDLFVVESDGKKVNQV